MIHPFDPSDAFVKPASYGIPLAGEVLFWDEQFDESTGSMRRIECSRDLGRGDQLRLDRNSIVYVTLECTLRLPDYVAARFNLTIPQIYRGLLVGTGPLVDPGFTGRIHLPLHNLTANDYDVVAGEPFVWMEFTKLSSNARWNRSVRDAPKRTGSYRPFPPRKSKRVTISDYLKDGRPVTSSIPQLVGKAQESAHKAEGGARRARNTSVAVSIVAGLGVFIGIAAMLVTVWQGNQDADRERDQLRQEITTLQQTVDRLTGSQGGSATPAPTRTPASTRTATP
jgi:deoxycytidine triphosphate deaminase